MPRVQSGEMKLAGVQTQISRIQAALAKLQEEIATLRRMQPRQALASARAPKTLHEARARADHALLVELGERCGWNRSRMAREAGIDRKSLYRMLKKLGLDAEHPAPFGPRPGTVAPPRTRQPARHRRR